MGEKKEEVGGGVRRVRGSMRWWAERMRPSMGVCEDRMEESVETASPCGVRKVGTRQIWSAGVREHRLSGPERTHQSYDRNRPPGENHEHQLPLLPILPLPVVVPAPEAHHHPDPDPPEGTNTSNPAPPPVVPVSRDPTGRFPRKAVDTENVTVKGDEDGKGWRDDGERREEEEEKERREGFEGDTGGKPAIGRKKTPSKLKDEERESAMGANQGQ